MQNACLLRAPLRFSLHARVRGRAAAGGAEARGVGGAVSLASDARAMTYVRRARATRVCAVSSRLWFFFFLDRVPGAAVRGRAEVEIVAWRWRARRLTYVRTYAGGRARWLRLFDETRVGRIQP